MKWIDYDDLTDGQKAIIIREFRDRCCIGLKDSRGRRAEWSDFSFAVREGGLVSTYHHARQSDRRFAEIHGQTRGQFLSEVDRMRLPEEIPGTTPEKGDISHHKVAFFGLNKEKS